MKARAVFSARPIKYLLAPLPLVWLACASSPEVENEKLAKLPAAERQALLAQERAVDVGARNLDTAKVAREEAEEFRDIVKDEIEAANARERERVDAETQVALRAKGEYADRLVELRGAERDLREAESRHARISLERAEYQALRARDLDEGMKGEDFERALRGREQEIADARQRVAQAEGYVEVAQETWNEARQRQQQAAARTRADETPIGAPIEPEPQPMPGAKQPPRERKQALD